MSNFIDRFSLRPSALSSLPAPETPPKSDKSKFRFLNRTPGKSRSFQGFSSFRSKGKKSRLVTPALSEQISSSTSPTSELAVSYPVTDVPGSPRKTHSLNLPDKSAEYPTYGSPIIEPESPLEGRHLKVSFAKSANKALVTDPLLFSPPLKSQGCTDKGDKEDDSMVFVDDITLSLTTATASISTNTTQSPVSRVSSNASSCHSSCMLMSMDATLQDDSPRTTQEKHMAPAIQRHEIDSPIIPPDAPAPESPQKLLHISQVLQRAARKIRDQQACTQSMAFRTIAPLLLFVSVLVIGVLLPRSYTALEARFGPRCHMVVPLLIFAAMGLILLMLRAIIWTISTLGHAFCDMDLTPVLRQGECRAVDGTRMRESDLIIGNFLLG